MAQKFASAAEAELACPVCFHYYVSPHDPKNLPKCSHICCRVCLRKMTTGGQKIVKCPQCNKESKLSDKGIDGLTTILALRNLAEKHPKGVKQRKEHMQSVINERKKDRAKTIQELEDLKGQMRASVKREEMEIEKAVGTLVTKGQELIGKINDMCQPRLNQIQQRVAQLEAEVKSIDALQAKVRTMRDDDFLAQTDKLTDQIEKLQIGQSDPISGDIGVGKFIVSAQLGRFVWPRRLKLMQEFGEFEGACDIASNPNGSLAVCDFQVQPPQVIVFQNANGKYRKWFQFDVQAVTKDTQINVTVTDGGKYLITKRGAGFDIHSSNGKYQTTVSTLKQKPNPMVKEYTISITSAKDSKILAASAIKTGDDESTKSVVTVFDSAGSILKTIRVGVPPYRIADIRGTHVAVSDGMNRDNVCVYDLKSGKETLNIDLAMKLGICYDEQSDCILIGRYTEKDQKGKPVDRSGAIEQYCGTTGKLVARLVEGLRGPAGRTLTRNGLLAVTDVKTVKLYKIS